MNLHLDRTTWALRLEPAGPSQDKRRGNAEYEMGRWLDTELKERFKELLRARYNIPRSIEDARMMEYGQPGYSYPGVMYDSTTEAAIVNFLSPDHAKIIMDEGSREEYVEPSDI